MIWTRVSHGMILGPNNEKMSKSKGNVINPDDIVNDLKVRPGSGFLRLRLEIEVKEGKMGVGKKYRGKLDSVLVQYVHDRLHNLGEVETKRIFITYPDMDNEIVERVRKAILEEKPFVEVLTSNAGCTVASHCGPKCLGILFYEA